ncbi:MAG: hypothetical protein ACI8W7_003246 [Gammaproteobacteria bacterium]|jgi:hypothetical protein
MLYPIVISQFSKMLGNLVAILDKADAHAQANKFDIEVLLQARLSPNQFNLMRQIQVACDTAKLAAARLADKEQDAPTHADTETNLIEIKARLQSVIDYLQAFQAADFDDAAQRRISQPRWKGKSLSGEEFLIQHAMPNLYFHVTTAYAILRHNGVAVGKMDYLGALPFKE